MKKYNVIEENRAWAESVFDKINGKLSKVAIRSRDIIADQYDKSGKHIDCRGIYWWTNGFWGGLNHLLYNATGNEDYLKTALASEKRLDRAFVEEYDELHHDVGFMWHILSGANYRLHEDALSRVRNLHAAAILTSRFVTGGNFIVAWNGKEYENCTIIDTMMNLPLLFWASRETGDDRFKRIAMHHADTVIRTHLRPDGSIAHIVEHDRETGDVVRTFGGQGYAEGSAWSRGQAWAVYGFTMAYIHTGEARYLDAARSAADYFLSGCTSDWLVPVDFKSPAEPFIIDNSAAVCAACGLIELGKLLEENGGDRYISSAVNLLSAIDKKYANYDSDTDYVVGHGTVRYPVDGDFEKAEVHVPIIYADYFYAEAILKLLGSEFNPW